MCPRRQGQLLASCCACSQGWTPLTRCRLCPCRAWQRLCPLPPRCCLGCWRLSSRSRPRLPALHSSSRGELGHRGRQSSRGNPLLLLLVVVVLLQCPFSVVKKKHSLHNHDEFRQLVQAQAIGQKEIPPMAWKSGNLARIWRSISAIGFRYSVRITST